MTRKLALTAGALALIATPLLTATSASATTSWVRQTISAGGCVAEQTILEGYNNSSHEYQQGVLTSTGGHVCEVAIIQFINGYEGTVSAFSRSVTPVYYDGPTYQDMVVLEDRTTGASINSSLY
ncbi:hypothetical protein GCM10009665_04560 [Kitasatospora nipponensis]|uniref:Beta/gamma crystallin n=1 Tax=Kitasatospora nipponensis TaxID=258049 RepID=A0ABN1VQX7_9ACTN